MVSLQEHMEIESARWAVSRRDVSYDAQSITSSVATSTVDSIFDSRLHSKYQTHTLSRRSSTSSFATEFEPEPAQQAFVAAVAQSTQLFQNHAAQGDAQGEGGGGEVVGEGGEQPRRLVTPGKLYENEEDDDEIIYD
ncbi:hypothetical protein E0Z10_g6665 [Xylaria hypoxylon]|uniref:Uncharacterized protein n=1 Tax=Xylaria hypoxylon TaxID=37992 RepID=A0A4Z0YCZ8_9PEZI|nr:hypothetical protein E0Z10_g6665 [Xylaria hypoxylon]